MGVASQREALPRSLKAKPAQGRRDPISHHQFEGVLS